MHYCTSYSPENSDGRTNIHRTNTYTSMSRLPASGVDNKNYIEFNELRFELLFTRMEKVDCIHVRAAKTCFINTLPICRGLSGGAKVLGKLSVPWRPTSLDDSRARACCTCSRCGWGLFGHFFSHLSFLSSFSLSLGDGPIWTEILSQRAVKPKTTNQPTYMY